MPPKKVTPSTIKGSHANPHNVILIMKGVLISQPVTSDILITAISDVYKAYIHTTFPPFLPAHLCLNHSRLSLSFNSSFPPPTFTILPHPSMPYRPLLSRRGRRSVADVDLFPAGLAEYPSPGSLLGPTFTCLLTQQFSSLKFGDRFWYQSPDQPYPFTLGQCGNERMTYSCMKQVNIHTEGGKTDSTFLSLSQPRVAFLLHFELGSFGKGGKVCEII